jgi:hypothetical protein
LDLLGELTVESISVEDGALEVWIKTDEFNWFSAEGRKKDDTENASN